MEKLFNNKYRIPSARLQHWNYANQAMYFVTICTKNRINFFGEISNFSDVMNGVTTAILQPTEIGKIAYFEWYKSVQLRPDMNLELGEFVVMPNHIHGIILIGANRYNNHTVKTPILVEAPMVETLMVETPCMASLRNAIPNTITNLPRNPKIYRPSFAGTNRSLPPMLEKTILNLIGNPVFMTTSSVQWTNITEYPIILLTTPLNGREINFITPKKKLNMSFSEWKKYKLGELGKVVTGKTPPTKDKENFGSEYPFITPVDMNGQKTIYKTERNLSEIGISKVKNFLLPKDAVCISCIGSDLGKVVKASKPSVTNQQINSIVCNGSFDSDFVYYSLKLLSPTIRNIGHQSTAVPIINKTDFSKFEIEVPENKSTQQRIAAILSSLDDAIELNQQMNKTLEEMAKAIFKEWFVDFNFPNATDKFQKTEIGKIPVGWKVGKLGDGFSITMGQSPPGESYNEEKIGMPFFQGRTDFEFRFPSNRIYTTRPKRFAKKLDTLVSVRAPVGDMNIASEDCCIGRGLAAVIHKNGNPSFTYYFLNSLVEKFKMFEGTGTVFGSINKSDFENMVCIYPPLKLIDEFERICSSFDEQIYNNKQENQSLINLRDTLLPKLMKGEIEINA